MQVGLFFKLDNYLILMELFYVSLLAYNFKN